MQVNFLWLPAYLDIVQLHPLIFIAVDLFYICQTTLLYKILDYWRMTIGITELFILILLLCFITHNNYKPILSPAHLEELGKQSGQESL